MRNRIIIIILLFLWFSSIPGAEGKNILKSPVISGHIRDAQNGEILIGANVYVRELGIGAITNFYGFYSLSVPQGRYLIGISFLGYETVEKQIFIIKDTIVNI